eukprot:TRINITY_DN19656_c0_g1_i1.p1 TRINITY_DN19656_c0_g1~~TRINITY_DN19656_c0_g1_i1.p1  ORF type:complete len:408 (-),score=70.62 TRINITY_DN19656_c0_g1_i1:116-1339(-)
MSPAPGALTAPAPGPTNVVVVSRIPEGVTELQISQSAGGAAAVLCLSYRPADLDGPGWAVLAFVNPEMAKSARDRLDGKPMPGLAGSTVPLDASLGEGLYGPLRRPDDQDSPWKEARTAQGQLYFYHAISRQTAWTKPPPEFPPGPPLATGGAGLVPPPGAAGPRGVAANLSLQRWGLVPPPAASPTSTTVLRPFVPQPSPQQSASILPPQQFASNVNSGAAAGQIVVSSTPAAAADAGVQGPVGSNLFIYHIPNSWDDAIMRQHFEHFGQIVSCRVQKDGENRPRGFGFVSYNDPAAAQAAIAGMHGFPVEGKHLKVQLKKGDEQQLEKPATTAGSPGVIDVGMPPSTPALPQVQVAPAHHFVPQPQLAQFPQLPPGPPNTAVGGFGIARPPTTLGTTLAPRPGPY